METLCPKCGAYWKCDCVIEYVAPPPLLVAGPSTSPYDNGCDHDWADAVGVEVIDPTTESRVFICRHCGLYRVEAVTSRDEPA